MEDDRNFHVFEERFKGSIDEYVLVKDSGTSYNLINVVKRTFVKFSNGELAHYSIERMLNLGIPVYEDLTDIPGIRSW